MKLSASPFGLFAIFVAVVLAAPFSPSSLLFWLDSIAVRVALIAVLLYVTRMGAIPSLFCFMALAALFLERNRRKVQHAQKALAAMDAIDPAATQRADLTMTPPTTVHPVEFDQPAERETSFLPIREMDTADFEPVGDSVNEKVVLASAYHGGAATVADRFAEY